MSKVLVGLNLKVSQYGLYDPPFQIMYDSDTTFEGQGHRNRFNSIKMAILIEKNSAFSSFRRTEPKTIRHIQREAGFQTI